MKAAFLPMPASLENGYIKAYDIGQFIIIMLDFIPSLRYVTQKVL
jgi:hypothetical protein